MRCDRTAVTSIEYALISIFVFLIIVALVAEIGKGLRVTLNAVNAAL